MTKAVIEVVPVREGSFQTPNSFALWTGRRSVVEGRSREHSGLLFLGKPFPLLQLSPAWFRSDVGGGSFRFIQDFLTGLLVGWSLNCPSSLDTGMLSFLAAVSCCWVTDFITSQNIYVFAFSSFPKSSQITRIVPFQGCNSLWLLLKRSLSEPLLGAEI